MEAVRVRAADVPARYRNADPDIGLAVQMTDSPIDKIQTDPTPMPDLGVELKPKGSEPGKLSFGERVYALFIYWRWHLSAALLVFIGFGAEYIHANIGKFETKYGAWGASVLFGLTGLIRTYQLTQMLKSEDTRQVEIK